MQNITWREIDGKSKKDFIPPPIWNPTIDEYGNKKTEGGPNDYIEGKYIMKVDQKAAESSYLIHILELEDGNIRSILGTMKLNQKMSKVPVNKFCRIEWIGLIEPTNKLLRIPYHEWRVSVPE